MYYHPLIIDYFTVLCSVARPWNESKAGVDLALVPRSLLFLRKSCCCNDNEFLSYVRKAVRFVSKLTAVTGLYSKERRTK